MCDFLSNVGSKDSISEHWKNAGLFSNHSWIKKGETIGLNERRKCPDLTQHIVAVLPKPQMSKLHVYGKKKLSWKMEI